MNYFPTLFLHEFLLDAVDDGPGLISLCGSVVTGGARRAERGSDGDPAVHRELGSGQQPAGRRRQQRQPDQDGQDR